jgi:putative flippase GtrA
VSILINIVAQYFTFKYIDSSYTLYIAIFNGTFFGLVFKYIVDKKFIFNFISNDYIENSGKFILYSLMGVLTTILFWGIEILFDAFYNHKNAKYIGAIIGLSIGYTVKYFLDKKFVFKT